MFAMSTASGRATQVDLVEIAVPPGLLDSSPKLSLGISVRHQVHAEKIVGSPTVGPRVVECAGNYLTPLRASWLVDPETFRTKPARSVQFDKDLLHEFSSDRVRAWLQDSATAGADGRWAQCRPQLGSGHCAEMQPSEPTSQLIAATARLIPAAAVRSAPATGRPTDHDSLMSRLWRRGAARKPPGSPSEPAGRPARSRTPRCDTSITSSEHWPATLSA
jgi:hypothetical protein